MKRSEEQFPRLVNRCVAISWDCIIIYPPTYDLLHILFIHISAPVGHRSNNVVNIFLSLNLTVQEEFCLCEWSFFQAGFKRALSDLGLGIVLQFPGWSTSLSKYPRDEDQYYNVRGENCYQ